MLEDMVRNQIEARGVRNIRVLHAMRTVPRQLFVPESERSAAFGDYPLPIGYGQTISQPYIVAVMTELLNTMPGDKVLEVGTGCGYQAAVLAAMGCEVYTLEIIPELARMATDNLKSAGCESVHVRCGSGYAGWPEKAPFKGIIVTCAPESVPQALIQQLAEGGRLVIPVGPVHYCQSLEVLEKKGAGVDVRNLMPVSFVPMTGEEEQ